MFLPALRVHDFHAMAGALGENFFQQFAIFKTHGRVDVTRQIGRVQIELLQQGRQEFRGIEFLQFFPVKIAAVYHAAASQVKKVHRNLRRLGVPGQNVGVVTRSRRNFLALFHFAERAK